MVRLFIIFYTFKYTDFIFTLYRFLMAIFMDERKPVMANVLYNTHLLG